MEISDLRSCQIEIHFLDRFPGRVRETFSPILSHYKSPDNPVIRKVERLCCSGLLYGNGLQYCLPGDMLYLGRWFHSMKYRSPEAKCAPLEHPLSFKECVRGSDRFLEIIYPMFLSTHTNYTGFVLSCDFRNNSKDTPYLLLYIAAAYLMLYPKKERSPRGIDLFQGTTSHVITLDGEEIVNLANEGLRNKVREFQYPHGIPKEESCIMWNKAEQRALKIRFSNEVSDVDYGPDGFKLGPIHDPTLKMLKSLLSGENTKFYHYLPEGCRKLWNFYQEFWSKRGTLKNPVSLDAYCFENRCRVYRLVYKDLDWSNSEFTSFYIGVLSFYTTPPEDKARQVLLSLLRMVFALALSGETNLRQGGDEDGFTRVVGAEKRWEVKDFFDMVGYLKPPKNSPFTSYVVDSRQGFHNRKVIGVTN